MTEEKPDRLNPEQIRESRIPLPSREDGYATVMLVGTTRIRKTTVLRHLIGSDRERFPSTSTARTTTADIEIISDSGPYVGVVTFMDQREVKDQIKLCLYQACQAAVRGQNDDRIARMLLSSQDQRFRLSYPLGRWDPNQIRDDIVQKRMTDLGNESISDTERKQIQNRLQDFVARIQAIARETAERTNATGSTLEEAQGAGERQAWLDIFTELLDTEDTLNELVSDISEEIRKRFDWIMKGAFTHGEDD